MTKSYEELLHTSQRFVEYLMVKKINAFVDLESFRDYSVKIRNVLGETILMYHKPSKSSFSIGTHYVRQNLSKEHIEKLWFEFHYGTNNEIAGLCAYVDGSFLNDKVGWGLLIVEDQQIIHTDKGTVDLECALGTQQIAGEIQGVLEALEYAKNHNKTSITICYDYLGLERWANKTWKAQSLIAQYYVNYLSKNNIVIIWHKVKAHSGHKYNEMVDQLAKAATTTVQ